MTLTSGELFVEIKLKESTMPKNSINRSAKPKKDSVVSSTLTEMDGSVSQLTELASLINIESEYWKILGGNIKELPPEKIQKLNLKVIIRLYKSLNNKLKKAAALSSEQLQRLEVEGQKTSLPVDEVDG